MIELSLRLRDALLADRPVVSCRLVETRGSTPQKAGAMMLVYPDGGQAGTLGGGCVEAEVKRRALEVMSSAAGAEVVKFQLDSDYGWDDGLICGGRMQVLIEPYAEQAARDYAHALAELSESGRGCSEAIVFDGQAAGGPSPAAYLFDPAGRLVAHVGGSLERGDAPAVVRRGLPDLSRRPRPSCQSGVAYLPLLPRCRLVIVGGGHVGKAVAELAVDLDFDVWVVDDREQYVSRERFPRAERTIAGDINEVLPDLPINASTYCLIVTRGHNHDEEALYHLVDRGAAYVGMIGSKRKIRLIYDDLLAEGIAEESLARVYAPVGLDIGSQTVPEIAVSIAAELLAHRNLGLRRRDGATLQHAPLVAGGQTD